MNIRDKERKIKTISFEIYKDQEKKLDDYFLEALIYSRNGDNVPSEIISNIIQILNDVWEYEDVDSFKIIDSIYERFKKRYDFKSKTKFKRKTYNNDGKLVDDERLIHMNLKLFIEIIIITTVGKKYDSKKSCLLDLLICINNIWEQDLNKTAQKLLSPYMRCALAGEIALRYKFTLFSGILIKPPTNNQLFHAVNDIIKTKKKR